MKLTQVVKVEGDYKILDNLAKITNGLYNSALYVIRGRMSDTRKLQHPPPFFTMSSASFAFSMDKAVVLTNSKLWISAHIC
jgi:hypothetical protein